MMIYVLKFSACMGILMLFYRVFLEGENMHRFKRFYLLGALFSAVLIPLITITEVVEVATIVQNTTLEAKEPPMVDGVSKEALSDTLPLVLWGIYLVGALLFAWQFFSNLVLIIRRIRNNPWYRSKNAIKVLLYQPIVPHTFFRFIFLNKQRYEAKAIPDAVLFHEEIHALQRHSLDVLFIELLQVVFWFNPLVYLAKSAIKLNHEFLADQGVLQKGISPSAYQNILLAYSSKALSPLPLTIGMANSLNYSSIKKRMSVMKTKTSQKSVMARSILFLPLLAVLLLGFAERKVVVKKSFQEQQLISLQLKNNKEIWLDHHSVPLERLASAIEKSIVPNTKIENVRLEALSDSLLDETFMGTLVTEISKAGVSQIKFCSSEFTPKEKREGQSENTENSSFTATNAKYRQLGPQQDPATKKQIEEYNALVKRINAQPENRRIYKKKEVERLEFIYGLMSEQQKQNAEPYPNFPPIPEPPAPQAPKEAMTPQTIRAPEQPIGIRVRTSPVAPEAADAPEIPEIEEPVLIHVEEIGEVAPPEAPEPPESPEPPMSPLDHVIEMAKADATFYYEGKKISSDKAIDILKKNGDINIGIKAKDGKKPVVTLYQDPYIIENR